MWWLLCWTGISVFAAFCEDGPATIGNCPCVNGCSGLCPLCCPITDTVSTCANWLGCCKAPCVNVVGYQYQIGDHSGDDLGFAAGYPLPSVMATTCDSNPSCMGFNYPDRFYKSVVTKNSDALMTCLYQKVCRCALCGQDVDALSPPRSTCGPPTNVCSKTSSFNSLDCWGSFNGIPGTCDCSSRTFTTQAPTNTPTTRVPTKTPTRVPTKTPTLVPTKTPTRVPSKIPTRVPTRTPTQTPTRTSTDFCPFVQADSELQAACMASSPAPSSVLAPSPTPDLVVASPLVEVTVNNSVSGPFIFSLPIFPGTLEQFLTPNCFDPMLRCEWQDPLTMDFNESGCQTIKDIDLGSGVMGARCVCSHLTVFALVLRNQFEPKALCQAQSIDYVLISFYAILILGLFVQIGRLIRAKAYGLCFVQHIVLFVIASLRLIFLVLKPVIDSLAGLVFLGLLPSTLSLSLFLHLLLAWASLQLFAFSASPFAKLRIPFAIIVCLVFLLTCSISIAVAVAPKEQIEIVTKGSYVLAALYACVCVMIIVAGLGLGKALGASTSGSTVTFARVRYRILASSIGISFCLLVGACLWVVAVQNEILGSSKATLAISVSFYVADWLSLCMLALLCSAAVTGATKSQKGKGSRLVRVD